MHHFVYDRLFDGIEIEQLAADTRQIEATGDELVGRERDGRGLVHLLVEAYLNVESVPAEDAEPVVDESVNTLSEIFVRQC